MIFVQTRTPALYMAQYVIPGDYGGQRFVYFVAMPSKVSFSTAIPLPHVDCVRVLAIGYWFILPDLSSDYPFFLPILLPYNPVHVLAHVY